MNTVVDRGHLNFIWATQSWLSLARLGFHDIPAILNVDMNANVTHKLTLKKVNSQIFEYERHLPGQDVSLLSDDDEDRKVFRRVHRRHVDPHRCRLWIEKREQ